MAGWRIPLGLILAINLVGVALGQIPVTVQRPDPNNAMIEGRIALPSGRAADLNVKITLSNTRSQLTTIYTNKHGEFRFQDLGAGTYYVQAVGDANIFEPVTVTMQLSRSQIAQLTITLRRKESGAITRTTGARVVSASELDEQAPEAAKREYDRAVKLIGKGKRAAAIEPLERAIAIYPDYLIARNDLGAQYLKLRQLDEAAEQFRFVLAKNPKYFNARFNLGLVCIEEREYAAAIAHLRQAIALDSTRPVAQMWLGVALLETGDLPAAERALNRALITGGAELVATHYYLAQLYLRRDDPNEAVRALNAYLEESPKGEFADDARRMLKQLKEGQ